MKLNLGILLLFILTFQACLSVKIFPEKQKVEGDFNLKNKKILIVTHDTEVSQEYLIYLKNHLRILFEKEKMLAHGINVRYTTPIKPRSIQSMPHILYEKYTTIPVSKNKVWQDKTQRISRVVLEEDIKTLADSTAKIQPDVILDIDVLHEHRGVYFTLDNSYQELKNAYYLLEIRTPDGSKKDYKNEINVLHFSRIDMLKAAKKTAEELIKKYKKDLIIK
jgi:hypothetical protein